MATARDNGTITTNESSSRFLGAVQPKRNKTEKLACVSQSQNKLKQMFFDPAQKLQP